MQDASAYQEHDMDSLDFPVEVLMRDTREEVIAVRPHWHQSFELQYMLEGSSTQILNGHAFRAGPGDLVVIRNGDIHATFCQDEAPARILVIKFLPELVYGTRQNREEMQLQALFRRPDKTVTCMIGGSHPLKGEVDRLLFDIAAEFRHQDEAYVLAVRGDLLRLVATLIRSGVLQPATLLDARHQALFDQLQRLIRSVGPANLSLAEAARAMHMNPSYFSRYFKQLTGQGFKMYVDRLRISEAERLIMNQGFTIGQAALACGYPSATVFSRRYRQIRGQPPGSMLKPALRK